MFDRFRDFGNPNLVVGIFLLVLLAVFAGPNTIPRALSNVLPFAYEGVPCSWLRQGVNRAQHQSLIGRAASNPIALSLKTTGIALASNGAPLADGQLRISVTIANNSLGTVPILYNPATVAIGDNGSSGLGLVFTPTSSINVNTGRQDFANIPETEIRLLGPRQRCVHTFEISASQYQADPNLIGGASQVRAYYRNSNRGQVIQTQPGLATPIYFDQGLWTGFVESDVLAVPVDLTTQ